MPRFRESSSLDLQRWLEVWNLLTVLAEEPEEEFEAYVRANYPRLVRFATMALGDLSKNEAEDLVQEVLLRSSFRWGRIVAQGDPDVYLRVSIRNKRNDFARRLKRRRKVLAQFMANERAGAASSSPQERATEEADLYRMLQLLPEDSRIAILARDYESKSWDQVAKTLYCSVSTAKRKYNAGVDALREMHGEEVTG